MDKRFLQIIILALNLRKDLKPKAILLISLELDEVLSLSDRILVMHNGEITGEFKGGTVSGQELGLYMSGAKKDNVNAIKEENK